MEALLEDEQDAGDPFNPNRPGWVPEGWRVRQKGHSWWIRHPANRVDLSKLPFDFFVNETPTRRALELIWLHGAAQLLNTRGEIWVPTNIVQLHGFDGIIPPLCERLGHILRCQVEQFIDPEINAYRIRPVNSRETAMPVDEAHWQELAQLVERAVREDHLQVSIESPHIPRPPNSFILYRQHHHRGVAFANRGVPNTEISRIIADMWRNETEEVRDRFKRLADEARNEHALRHPNYHYQPRRNGRRPRRLVRAPVSLLSFIGAVPAGQRRLEEAINNNDDGIDVDEDLIAIFDNLGMAYGPNGLLPPPSDERHDSRFQDIVNQQLSLQYLEGVHWSPLRGDEFGENFDMQGMLDLPGASH